MDTEQKEVPEHNYPALDTLTEDEQFELLLKAMHSDPAIRQAFIAGLKDPVKKQPLTAKCRTFKNIIVVHNCTHCGATLQFQKTITPESGMRLITRNGTDIRVNYSEVEDNALVHTYTSHCDGCKAYIASLSREELEQRYNELIIMLTAPLSKGGIA